MGLRTGERGMAVHGLKLNYYANYLINQLTNKLHTGCPVVHGVKWGKNLQTHFCTIANFKKFSIIF